MCSAPWGGEGVPDFGYSLGIGVDGKGIVRNVGWDSPAFKAGLAPGVKILTVSGHAFSLAHLAAAVSARAPGGIALTVELDGQERALNVAYAGGMRYPVLERIPGTSDRLRQLLQAR